MKVKFSFFGLSLAFLSFGSAPAAAQSSGYGSFCSAALYRSNWGVLVGTYEAPSSLCRRIQAEYLFGLRPDLREAGYYPLYAFNRVTVSCSSPYPSYWQAVGYGSEAFFAAYQWATASGGQGCLFSVE